MPLDKSEKSTSCQWSVVFDVLSDVLYRACRPDDVHLFMYSWHYISLRCAFASRSTSTHYPRRSPNALLPILYSILNVFKLYLRQDGLCSKYLAQYSNILWAHTVYTSHCSGYAGSQ